MPAAPAAPLRAAGLGRRGLALLYEILLVTAVVLFGAVLGVPATQLAGPLWARPLLQIALCFLVGAYFIWQWTHGQTLAMKTWRIRIVGPDGTPPDARRALLRLAVALAGSLLLGAGFAWALVDRDRQFLHDRVAGTRLVAEEDEGRKAQP